MDVKAFDIDPAANQMWIETGMEEKRYQYDVKHSDTILDIGAYQGDWSRGMVERYNCHSIMFEPVPRMLMNFHMDPRYDVIEAAAWTYNGRLKFGGNAYWTSHYLESNQEYDCVDIRQWLNQSIKVCKINIEGGEYMLLNHILIGANEGRIQYPENIQVQFHKVHNNEVTDCEKAYQYYQRYLSKNYKKTWGLDWVWENWERI